MISNKQPNVPRQRARKRKTQAKDGRKQNNKYQCRNKHQKKNKRSTDETVFLKNISKMDKQLD